VDRLRCSSCHDVIGAYEPIAVVLSDGSERAGSISTLRSELRNPDVVAMHERCRTPG
jgi:hypothetical protein